MVKKIVIAIVAIGVLGICCYVGLQGDGCKINRFVSRYASNYPGDSYYERNNLDYHHLYDISLKDADVQKRSDGYMYDFVIFAYFDNTADHLKVVTDRKKNVESIVLTLSNMSLFRKGDDLISYLSDILSAVTGTDDHSAAAELYREFESGKTLGGARSDDVILTYMITEENLLITVGYVDE